MSDIIYPEMVRVRLRGGDDTWPVVLYDLEDRVRWAAYRHGHGLYLIKQGTSATRLLAIEAAKKAIAIYRKTKVRCKICDDTGCYTCDG